MGGGSSSSSNSSTQTYAAQNSAANSDSQMAFGTNTGNQYGQNSGQNSLQTYAPSDLAQSYLKAGTNPAYNNISNYYNPFQQQVINATLGQLGQYFGQQNSAVLGNAIANGALGGDRQAIAQAALAGQQGLAAGSTLAGENLSGWQQALAAAMGQNAQNLQAAGMSGGTSLGQNLSSILGGSLGSTLGEVNAAQATAGTSRGQSLSNTQSSSSSSGGGKGSMGGIASMAGMLLADGGRVHRDSGGGIDPIQMMNSDGGLSAMFSAMNMLKGQGTPQAPALPEAKSGKGGGEGHGGGGGGSGGQKNPLDALKKQGGQGQDNQSNAGDLDSMNSGDSGSSSDTGTADAAAASDAGSGDIGGGDDIDFGGFRRGGDVKGLSALGRIHRAGGGSSSSAPAASTAANSSDYSPVSSTGVIQAPQVSAPNFSAPHVTQPNVRVPQFAQMVGKQPGMGGEFGQGFGGMGGGGLGVLGFDGFGFGQQQPHRYTPGPGTIVDSSGNVWQDTSQTGATMQDVYAPLPGNAVPMPSLWAAQGGRVHRDAGGGTSAPAAAPQGGLSALAPQAPPSQLPVIPQQTQNALRLPEGFPQSNTTSIQDAIQQLRDRAAQQQANPPQSPEGWPNPFGSLGKGSQQYLPYRANEVQDPTTGLVQGAQMPIPAPRSEPFEPSHPGVVTPWWQPGMNHPAQYQSPLGALTEGLPLPNQQPPQMQFGRPGQPGSVTSSSYYKRGGSVRRPFDDGGDADFGGGDEDFGGDDDKTQYGDSNSTPTVTSPPSNQGLGSLNENWGWDPNGGQTQASNSDAPPSNTPDQGGSVADRINRWLDANPAPHSFVSNLLGGHQSPEQAATPPAPPTSMPPMNAQASPQPMLGGQPALPPQGNMGLSQFVPPTAAPEIPPPSMPAEGYGMPGGDTSQAMAGLGVLGAPQQEAPAEPQMQQPQIQDPHNAQFTTMQPQRVRGPNGYGQRLTGTIDFGGGRFSALTGGAGRGSIPFGTYQVGKAEWHPNLGGWSYPLSDVQDPYANDKRTALFIHAGNNASLGCVAIPPEQFGAFRKAADAGGLQTLTIAPPSGYQKVSGPDNGQGQPQQGDWGNYPHSDALAQDRQEHGYAQELQNPQFRSLAKGIMAGENNDPEAARGVLESAMNRASVNGTTLAQEMRRTIHGGYYAGYNPSAVNDPRTSAMLDQQIDMALNGSNSANYGTDNSSGDWGRNRIDQGMFKQTGELNGELFQHPGNPDARGFDKYPAWLQKVGGDPSQLGVYTGTQGQQPSGIRNYPAGGGQGYPQQGGYGQRGYGPQGGYGGGPGGYGVGMQGGPLGMMMSQMGGQGMGPMGGMGGGRFARLMNGPLGMILGSVMSGLSGQGGMGPMGGMPFPQMPQGGGPASYGMPQQGGYDQQGYDQGPGGYGQQPQAPQQPSAPEGAAPQQQAMPRQALDPDVSPLSHIPLDKYLQTQGGQKAGISGFHKLWDEEFKRMQNIQKYQRQGQGAQEDAIPSNLKGDEFIAAAQKAGVSAGDLASAKMLADYKADPKNMTMREDKRQRIINLAYRINPDYNTDAYPAHAGARKNLESGPLSKAMGVIGRGVDEGFQTDSLVDPMHNSKLSWVNATAGATYPSGSEYGKARNNYTNAAQNFSSTSATIAKGGSDTSEAEVMQRRQTIGPDLAGNTLHDVIRNEMMTMMNNGQASLNAQYNVPRGLKPGDKDYKYAYDYLTDAQKGRLAQMTGITRADQINGSFTPHDANSQQQAAPSIPQGAIEMLQKNPNLAPQFDFKYGKGASQQYLRQ